VVPRLLCNCRKFGGVAGAERTETAEDDLSDHELMRFIADRWGKAIWTACRSSSVPPEFMAALIANESSADAEKKQFREEVYERLICVRGGKNFHSLSVTPQQLRAMNEDQMVELATAWGLTQVMGYHVLGNGSLPRHLLVPEYNLISALQRLAVFSEQCGIDLRAEFEDLFRCWAAGRPDGTPADRAYVETGMRRLGLYREIVWNEFAPLEAAA